MIQDTLYLAYSKAYRTTFVCLETLGKLSNCYVEFHFANSWFTQITYNAQTTYFIAVSKPALGDSNDKDPHQDGEIPTRCCSCQLGLTRQCQFSPSSTTVSTNIGHGSILAKQKTSSYDLQQVFGTAATVSCIPRHIPSEHPGGDARGGIMKSRAAKVTLTVSEVFALATSGTHSFQDTAVVLETFGNVS